MSAVLRAFGSDFDVNAFLVGCTLPVCAVKRRGEPVYPTSQPDGRRHTQSSVNVTVSDAEFDDLPRQVADAIEFLRTEAVQVRRLCAFPGIDGATLDFGIERRDVAVQCNHLSPELVRLAGLLGLGIELTQYWSMREEPDARTGL